MSVIVKAQMNIKTKFEDKECLLKSIESLNLSYKERGNTIILTDKDVSFVKDREFYTVQYISEHMDGRETYRGKEITK